jgi:hypothetical protein
MSIATLTRRNTYLGDGTTTSFPYTFKIFDQSQLAVYRLTVLNAELALSLGTDYSVSGVGLTNGGTIQLAVAPLVGETIVILGAQPLTQSTSIRNQDAYYPATIEDNFDMSRMIDQQLSERVDRCFKVPATTGTFQTRLNPVSAADGLKVFRINQAGTGLEVVDIKTLLASAGGGVATGYLNNPTDGTYGGASGNPAGVAKGDLYEDAFDKVATLLGKITPTPPQNLSALVLSIPSSYQAFASGSGALHAVVTDNQSPTVTPGLAAVFANAFGDADRGTLQALVDAAVQGLVTLTTGDDSGLSNGWLTVLSEFDPYAGQAGKSGIFKAITAKIQAASLSVGAHTAQLVDSVTGSTPQLSFYVDDPATPSASVTSITPSGATVYKSGVPSYAAGATLAVAFQIASAIRTHYSALYLAAVNSSAATAIVTKSPATVPAANTTYSDTANLTILNNFYGESVAAQVTGYNSKQAPSTTVSLSQPIRVDSIGTETRVTSGTGQFPTSGYGQAYDSTLSLASNKALQYLAGAYRYPPLVSYAGSLPAGPDYSGLTPDTYNNMRWVTFNFGSVSAVTSVLFAFQSANNFGTSTIVSGLALYVRVDGSSGTTGWIDANQAYSGVGSPTANGDAALDVSQSTATQKRVTFGTAPKTGTVFVRVGIPSGSNKFFGSIA